MFSDRFYAVASLRYTIVVLILGLVLCSGITYCEAPQPYALQPVSAYGGGLVRGMVRGYDMYSRLYSLSWATVTASDGKVSFSASTRDGYYELFLPEGTYILTATLVGYKDQTISIVVLNGSTTSINFELEESGIPIPEFSSNVMMAITFLTLLLCIGFLRRLQKSKGLKKAVAVNIRGKGLF